MKRGSGACDAPRLNARRFEEMVVEKIRSNILTEGNIRELVKLVDEEMDGVAHEQRQRLETAESELADVRRRLERLYNLVETTDMDIDDFKPRIRDHRERQERLEAAADEARAMLSQRRVVLDDVKTITAYAEDMSEFLERERADRAEGVYRVIREGDRGQARQRRGALLHSHARGQPDSRKGRRGGGPSRAGTVYRQVRWAVWRSNPRRPD